MFNEYLDTISSPFAIGLSRQQPSHWAHWSLCTNRRDHWGRPTR